MQIQLFDADWRPVSDLVEATARSVSKIRANQACSFSFAMPRNSVRTADLDIAANVLLMGRIPGRITSRRVDGGLVEIEGLSAEDLLNGFKTPRRWVRWNHLDLADVVRDLLKPFRWIRWSTQADWQGAVAVSNVDLTTEPGSVVLATEPYLNAERYVASGSITLRVQLPEEALPTGRVVRWTERVGTATRIKVQTRAADSASALDSTPWGPELEVVHAEDVEENEDWGVQCADGGRWVDIRLNLYTDDQYSSDNDSNPSIFGFTPILDAVELIYRVPGPITEGSIPASTGVTVTDYEASRITHLRCLVELCERYGHTFRIRLDSGRLVLDLAQTFGQDRSADVRLIAGENCVIERLSDSDQDSVGGGKRVSVLHCWGAGEGVDQLYYRAVDWDLVARIGWVEDDWEDTSITDLAALQARGEEELAKRKQVREEAEVTTVPHVLGEAWLQDTVTIIDPESGVVKSLLIEEIRVEENPDTGELVRLGLGTQLVDLVDEIIRGRALPTGIRAPERPPGKPSRPAVPKPVVPPPSNVRPFSVFRGVGARQDVPTGFPWAATEFHVSPVQGFTPDASTRVETARKTEFEAKNLMPGGRYFMRLRNIDAAGNVSEWSPEISAVAGQATGADVQSDGTLLMGLLPSGGYGFGSMGPDGDRSELTNGRLAFYRAGQLKPFFYIRHIEFGVDPAGMRVEFRAPFDRPPRVLTAVADMLSYDPDVGGRQRWSVRAEDVDAYGFTPRAELLVDDVKGSENTKWGVSGRDILGTYVISSLDNGYPTPWSTLATHMTITTGRFWTSGSRLGASYTWRWYLDIMEESEAEWTNVYASSPVSLSGLAGVGRAEATVPIELPRPGRYAWRMRFNVSGTAPLSCTFSVDLWEWWGSAVLESVGQVQWIAVEDPLEDASGGDAS